ncbi:MAG: M48 family metalloprotease [Rickettsiales bacterium]|nr:M48 family metalloprotease [Rickettsiales bacterium]
MNIAAVSRIKPQILAIAAVFSLVACTPPSTVRPNFTQAELEAERDIETDLAMENPFPPLVEPVYANKKMKERLQRIVNRVAPAASKLCYAIHGPHAVRSGEPEENTSCSYTVFIEGRYGFNAWATGTQVGITAPMIASIPDDTQLAMVIAHEFAHNIMEHLKRKSENAVIGRVIGTMGDVALASQRVNSNGVFGKIGDLQATLSYSPEYEQEADYVGLYILARAGYRIEQAPPFWRALSRYASGSLYIRTTHPTNAERYVGMNKAIAEIRAKQRAKQPLIPNIRTPEA